MSVSFRTGTPLFAHISCVCRDEVVMNISLSRENGLFLTLGVLASALACVALGLLAVWLGAALLWGLLLLSVVAAIASVYNEHGRNHCAEGFAVR